MSTIAFIGLGNMGGPMARNLVNAGHTLAVYDRDAAAMARVAGTRAAANAADAAKGADAVITMLPAGRHVDEVYLGAGGIIGAAPAGALLIDCSTIDVATARRVNEAAAARGHAMLDAPVSGGVAGAEAGTLTFMVGGEASAFERGQKVLASMGKTIVHAGGAGNGQAAKICNNLILGISMIGVCEAFVLAEKLGLDADKLFAISSKSSGQCWSLTSYCPVPGPVPTSPANRGYKPGFAASMMLKDLRLAQEAAASPMGALAEKLYQQMDASGQGGVDFSGIIHLLRSMERPNVG
jgi:3-hydroxyisobutyrate dehydrogenase